jgi:hypothetical protein
VSELTSPIGQRLLGEHRDAGVAMRFIARGAIGVKLAPQLQQLGDKNLDFAIFDDDVVLVWRLDGQRKVLDAEVLVGEEVARKFGDFFRALWEQAGTEPW